MTGKEFRKWRRNQDITQQQIADKVEVNKCTISRWENGLINIHGELYNKLIKIVTDIE